MQLPTKKYFICPQCGGMWGYSFDTIPNYYMHCSTCGKNYSVEEFVEKTIRFKISATTKYDLPVGSVYNIKIERAMPGHKEFKLMEEYDVETDEFVEDLMYGWAKDYIHHNIPISRKRFYIYGSEICEIEEEQDVNKQQVELKNARWWDLIEL